jgi:DNA (cytosine-5)-methyltransferase 1
MKYNHYTHLDLFSGIGGFSLGLESTGGFETVAFCEFDKVAQKVLELRWPNVPIFEDIRGINEETLCNTSEQGLERGARARVQRNSNGLAGTGNGDGDREIFADIITGGFPCQPFSVAGKRAGTEDNRYLWPELLRVIRLVKPTWCILENVRGLLSIEDGLVFENCLLDLEAAGYEHQTLVIPACAVNAQHRRDRVWIICRAKQDGVMADTNSTQCERRRPSIGAREEHANISSGSGRNAESRLGGEFDGISRWLDESGLPKVSSGVPNRANRLKQLGNSIVPQIAAAIGYAILEI